jgi:hypothetical protein
MVDAGPGLRCTYDHRVSTPPDTVFSVPGHSGDDLLVALVLDVPEPDLTRFAFGGEANAFRHGRLDPIGPRHQCLVCSSRSRPGSTAGVTSAGVGDPPADVDCQRSAKGGLPTDSAGAGQDVGTVESGSPDARARPTA